MKYYKLTTQQANIWKLQKYYEGTSISNLCGAIIYDESRDLNALHQAINAVIDSNDSLRLRFSDHGEAVQYLADCDVPIEIKSFESESELDMYAESVARFPMSITNSQMCFFTVFSLGKRSGILAKLNHLISDAWSFGLIANQIEDAYQKNKADKTSWGYLQYIQKDEEYINSERYTKDRKFWEERYQSYIERTQLKQIDSTILSNNDSIVADRITKHLPKKISERISAFCNSHRVSEAILFESAVLLYLYRANPENKTVTIGFPILNRGHLSEKNSTGMFVSTIPLTVSVNPEDSVSFFMDKVSTSHRTVFRHQHYPYEEMLKDLRKNHSFTGNLYDVMVSVQNATVHGQAPFKTKWYSNGYSEVPLVVSVDRRDDRTSYTITLDYQLRVFPDKREAELLYERILCILTEFITDDPEKNIYNTSILPEKEKILLLEQFNDTYKEYPKIKCVHELFREQVVKTPDMTALIFGNRRFTYRELDEMSDSLSRHLRNTGNCRNEIIPIIAKRDWRIIVAMLGILKAGGAYMPVSPEYPNSRIRTMLEIVKCRRALCYGYDGDIPVERIELSEFEFDKNQIPVENSNDPDDLCYIIFTSGSTGMPKGCCIKHRNFANTLLWRKGQYSSVNKDIICTSSTFTDTFGEDVFSNLISNNTLHLVSDNKNLNAVKDELESSITGRNCLMTTPTFFSAIMSTMKNAKWSDVTLVGEQLTKDIVDKYATDFETLHNEYGPSECSVCASYKKIGINDSIITIGRPIANTQIYILDDRQGLLPMGVAGELCIAGEGVGKGYLNRPDLTAERFIPNPYATEENRHGKVLYRTGDLARWQLDGEIEYLGRIDTQVKIRGLRIELGEIESVMTETEGIGLVAAAVQKDETGRQYLVGYYTSDAEIDEKDLRKQLAKKLPLYMVPNYFMHLDTMPMTASGKTDRKNLPLPEMSSETREYLAPDTETERKLAKLWVRTLQVDKVGKTDDFFELGGDSLSAITLLSKIEELFDAGISIQDLYKHSILSEMAQLISIAGKTEHLSSAHSDGFELLPQQKAIYASYRKAPDSLVYNAPGRLKLDCRVDRDRLKKAIYRVLSSHKVLNCRIIEKAGEPYAVYDPDAKLLIEELSSEEGFLRPFDLNTAPLVHIALTEESLLFDVHHIVCDGASLKILLDEIADTYEEMNTATTRNEKPFWYGDYAAYIQNKDFSTHIEYFRNKLNYDFESIKLPEIKLKNVGGKSVYYSIEHYIYADARRFAKRHGLSDTMLFFGAFGFLMSKYSNRKKYLTSIVLQSRAMADTKDMVGMFVNTLPICINTDGSVTEYYQRIKKDLTELYQYQEVSFLTIAQKLNFGADTINTSFVYQPDGSRSVHLGDFVQVPEQMETGTAKFDLLMEILPTQGDVIIRLEYNREKYDDELLDRLADAYRSILRKLGEEKADEIESLHSIDILPEKEKELLLNAFNDTRVEYPRQKCVHELFMEQAALHPNQAALEFDNDCFTYRQLDQMSNAIAFLLQKNGVCADTVVPIISKRNWRMIVAMLGVLKAGGAYFLIDHTYPEERIRYLCDLCDGNVAISDTLIRFKSCVIDINTITTESVLNRSPKGDSDACKRCCIIHTSGSTGKPKATVLTHNNLYNYIGYAKVFFKDVDVALSTTSIAFDAFQLETVVALCNGIKVALYNEEQISSQELFEMTTEQHDRSFLFQTPTKIANFIRNSTSKEFIKRIKSYVIGGEVFPRELAETIKMFNPEASIFNIYGPTETTICVTTDKVKLTSDITIGRPIANTQIYILDDSQHLLPIGVAGELCIAGAGVGQGYLNRPDLTKERFIQNPFATEMNGHGKTLYLTGDLARWRVDGKIEYLGRVDTQVKIRGLRIELSEIESAMSGYPGIKMVAVNDKRDENGRQYLVGYYTSDAYINVSDLRKFLGNCLPRYMVPNYFMHLNAMPMTLSGKTDRKNLPLPDMSGEARDYEAPVTDTELKLCRLMEDILSIERIGTRDDFFELGGDSLKAISFVAMAHEAGIEISLQSIYDHATIKEMCEYMQAQASGEIIIQESGASNLHVEALMNYHSLLRESIVDESLVFHKKALGNVFLTGATGFLGAHILDALMKHDNGLIYCLVRGKTNNEAQKHLDETLQWYFGSKYHNELERRIIPVKGSIEQENLSDDLPKDIQTIIHAAALVKHFGKYEVFHKVNVGGTENITKYAKKVNAQLIHISTTSVSGNVLLGNNPDSTEEVIDYSETDYYIGQNLQNVYVRSKFEAERVVMDSICDGKISARIIRIGNLTNRTNDYRFQPNYESNAFLRRMKALIDLGMFPEYLLPYGTEFSPVDLTAEGIIKIAQYADKQIVFHLFNDRLITNGRLLTMLRNKKIPIDVVSDSEFREALEATISDPQRSYIYEALETVMDQNNKIVLGSGIHVNNRFTDWFLSNTGFSWNEIDEEYLGGYIAYFREAGYLNV